MLNILLVDDEKLERDGISYLINKYKLPLNVSEASNGKKALEYIKSNNVDILLTDVEMPYMDGLDLAKEAFEYNKNIKTIIFSAHSEFEYAKRALEASAVNYLLKPIEIDEFKNVMNEVISICEEKKKESEYQNTLKSFDKKMLLYKILTGGKVHSLKGEQLNKCDTLFDNSWMILINIETQNSIFAENDNVFLKLVKTYIPYDYEYINIYPHSAYLILHNKNKMSIEKIKSGIKLLNRDMKLLINEFASFIVGQSFNDINKIGEKAEILNSIRSDIYDFENKVFFEEVIKEDPGYYAEEIERVKAELIRAIDDKDLDKVSIYANKLIKSLINNKSISKIYVSNVFYDLVNKLYMKFEIFDKSIINKRIESLIRCKDGIELENSFQKILEEIAKNNNVEIIDGKGIARKVIKIIKMEYMNDLSLDYIAEKVNFAPAYLSYIFKKETGSNIIKHITDYRMKRAKSLLEEGKLKIVQVGRYCGYENQSYFNRLFKNYYGVTPKQFKEKNND